MEKGQRKEEKKYPDLEEKIQQLQEPVAAYSPVSINSFEQAFISQRGLSISVIDTISQKLHLNKVVLAKVFEMSEKTLRTRLKKGDRLRTYESDLALSLLDLSAEGMKTFEQEGPFISWLHTEWEALGFKKPLDFLNSVSGVQFLIDELKSIRHGIFA